MPKVLTPPGDEHLLYEPTGDAAGLLGKAVSRGTEGQMVVADELAPGCLVSVRERPSSWTRQYTEDIGKVGFGSSSLSVLASLRGRYGTQLRTRGTISNVKELVADLQGNCGELVIKSVKVGSGSRELQYRRDASGEGSVSVGNVSVGGGAEDWVRIGESLKWADAQAWSFTVGVVRGTEEIGLRVEMPSELTDGDQYVPRVTTARDVWLIVLAQEPDGRTAILLPNAENPNMAAAARQQKPLPTLRVSLRDPTTAAREKLILYAFTERADYERFRPPAGNVSEDEASAYARALPDQLAQLPQRRWGRSETTYLIKSRPEAAP